MAEVIRLALDSYLDDEERLSRPLDPATSRWFGAWRDEDVSESRSIRDQLVDRAERLNT